MEHPQPAVDLLISLPPDSAVDKTTFLDWHAVPSVEAGPGDDVVDHPEIWTEWDLPDALSELTTEDYVSVQRFDGSLNLNALAIGLGLANISYDPETFPGVVYDPEEYDATVFLFGSELYFAVGDTSEATSEVVHHTLETLESLGLTEASYDSDVITGRVSEFI